MLSRSRSYAGKAALILLLFVFFVFVFGTISLKQYANGMNYGHCIKGKTIVASDFSRPKPPILVDSVKTTSRFTPSSNLKPIVVKNDDSQVSFQRTVTLKRDAFFSLVGNAYLKLFGISFSRKPCRSGV